jgi:lipoate---protein ligase
MQLLPYDLPDSALLTDTTAPYRFMIWEPTSNAIILGQSNELESSVFTERAESDGIPVYQRPSGGETVILTPNTTIISILKLEVRLKSPRLYFNSYNEKIITALESLGIKKLRTDGISDICIGKKKILGSSIYRNKERVIYHAVLNRAESTDTIERYLKHPTREPDYRNGRRHSDFVTSIEKEGYALSAELIRNTLTNRLSNRLSN